MVKAACCRSVASRVSKPRLFSGLSAGFGDDCGAAVPVARKAGAHKDRRDARTTNLAESRFLLQTEATIEYLAEFPRMRSRFVSDFPELAQLRVCRVKGFPNHLIFYIEHHAAIEIVRILHGAMDLETELRDS